MGSGIVGGESVEMDAEDKKMNSFKNAEKEK